MRSVRRPLLFALLLGVLALASAGPAVAATSDARIETILRDCEDDGTLDPSYRPSELRDAVRNIGTDLDQYSDCRDVISAAVLDAVSGGGGGGSEGSGTGAVGSRTGTGGLLGTGGGEGTGSTGSGGGFVGSGPLLTPAGPDEQVALDEIRASAPGPTAVGGRPVELPGNRPLAAIMASDLPTPLLVALGLLTAGGFCAALPTLRRRFLDRRAA